MDGAKFAFMRCQPGNLITFGQFFNGSRVGLEGSLTYRYQPLGFISVDYGINRLKLAAPFRPANVWLIGPRIDLTFTKSIFLTTFVQYNSQFDNLNINTRFQWRFQPVSDFFLVYTDNYLTDPFSQFSSRNRSLAGIFVVSEGRSVNPIRPKLLFFTNSRRSFLGAFMVFYFTLLKYKKKSHYLSTKLNEGCNGTGMSFKRSKLNIKFLFIGFRYHSNKRICHVFMN